jgi:hypothetical protein
LDCPSWGTLGFGGQEGCLDHATLTLVWVPKMASNEHSFDQPYTPHKPLLKSWHNLIRFATYIILMGGRDTFLSPTYAWLHESSPSKDKACLQRI